VIPRADGKPGEPMAVDAVLREGSLERPGADDEGLSLSPLALPENRRQRERLAAAELLREVRTMITGPRDALAGGPGSP
jgi:hypothetical protein